jgi:hypothetical protein
MSPTCHRRIVDSALVRRANETPYDVEREAVPPVVGRAVIRF